MEIIGVSRLLSVVASMEFLSDIFRFSIREDTTLHRLYHNLYISGPLKETKNLYPIVATVRDEDSVIGRYYVILNDVSHGYNNHLMSMGLILSGGSDPLLVTGGDISLYTEMFLELLNDYFPDPDHTYKIIPHVTIEDRPVLESDLFWSRVNDIDEGHAELFMRSVADPPLPGLSIEA